MLPSGTMTGPTTVRESAPRATRTSGAAAVRAALLLAFGLVEGGLILLAFEIPQITVRVLVRVMATFVVSDSLAALVEAARGQGRRWALVGRALTGVTAGLAILLLAPIWSIKIFAAWAIVTGILGAAEGAAAGPIRVVVPALSVALGLLLIGGAVPDPVRALLAISVYGVIGGGIGLGATRLRPAHR
jgi:hypothetical protein